MKEKSALKPICIETVKELWSKTYNTDGKPDWSHIFPYYHKNIIFELSLFLGLDFSSKQKLAK